MEETTQNNTVPFCVAHNIKPYPYLCKICAASETCENYLWDREKLKAEESQNEEA